MWVLPYCNDTDRASRLRRMHNALTTEAREFLGFSRMQCPDAYLWAYLQYCRDWRFLQGCSIRPSSRVKDELCSSEQARAEVASNALTDVIEGIGRHMNKMPGWVVQPVADEMAFYLFSQGLLKRSLESAEKEGNSRRRALSPTTKKTIAAYLVKSMDQDELRDLAAKVASRLMEG